MEQDMSNGEIYKHLISKVAPAKEGDLCVYWIPQVPGKPFEWRVANLDQAAMLLDALAAYDDFQFWQRVKGDYSNTGGLLIFRDGEWEDWESDECDDFDTWRTEREAA